MIPKIIHYCWFGQGEMPERDRKCMESWKLFLSDYEFKLWNEDNFDIHATKFTRQAYEKRKFAFVADYARLCALEQYGGLYLDTDVEVLKNLDEFLKYDSFIGFEEDEILHFGTVGACAHTYWVRELMSYYEKKSFIRWNGRFNKTPIAILLSRIMKKHGVDLSDSSTHREYRGFHILPKDYFNAYSYRTGLNITENTHSLHYYNPSWK